MNDNRFLQLITALTVIAVGMVAVAMIGGDSVHMGITLVTGILLIAVMWDRHSDEFAPSPIPVTEISPYDHDLIADDAFREIVEHLSDPVLVVDRGKVTLANPGALKLLGQHIVGQDVRIAIRHPAAAQRLASADSVDKAVCIDIVGLGARNLRWAMQIIPITQPGDRSRLFVHLSDESHTYAAERQRGDFVANASHELRTPLAAILGFVETLQDPHAGGDSETRERFLSILEKEARRMQRLVDDLMSLSRIEADKYRLPTAQVDTRETVEEVVSLCRQNLGERGRDIVTELADDIPFIQGDQTQIAQLLHNLIGNSAKYGRTGTPITVRVALAPPSMLRLEVADEGEGIAEDHLPRLTERFYRVDSGRSRAMGGTGLGLAIVKHIVERHRGRLDIASALGKGTVITILLPVSEQVMPVTSNLPKVEQGTLS